ncbi:MAG: c-type cytochrome [Acidobacteriota bacterium]
MRYVSVVLLVVCVSVGATGHAQAPGGSPEGKKLKNPVAASPASVAAGRKTFQKMCAFCHGKDASGNGPMVPKGMTAPSNLVDATWDRGSTDGEIFMILRDGAGPKFEMKGFKERLPDEDLWNVVNYLRSLDSKAKSQ